MSLWTSFSLESLSLDSGDAVEAAMRTAAGMLVATVLSIMVAIAYRSTHRGMQYSSSFAMTLVMLAAVGTLVMVVIGDSLARAFGVFGALSLIRFRTAVKDPKDIAYVFLALAIGMAAGTGRYVTAATGTVMMLSVILLLHALRFGTRTRDDYLLRVVFTGTTATTQVPAVLGASTRRLVMLTMQAMGPDGVESTWLTSLRGKPEELVQAIRSIPGVTDVHLTATAQEVEL